jgi:hypothetical protein
MSGANDYGEPKAAQHRRGTQHVLNEPWPLKDKSGGHARGIEDRPNPLDVEVRIEWADGGEEWIAGSATRGRARTVFVRFQHSVRPVSGLAVADRVRVGSCSGRASGCLNPGAAGRVDAVRFSSLSYGDAGLGG